jgi:dynein light intermediate chain 1
LNSYIKHLLFSTGKIDDPFPLHLEPQIINRDSILIPIGWDTRGKIKLLQDTFDCETIALEYNQVYEKESLSDSWYEKVLYKYSDNLLNINVIPEVNCEEDQTFLQRQYELLQTPSQSQINVKSTSVNNPINTNTNTSTNTNINTYINTKSSANVAEDVSIKLERLNRLKDAAKGKSSSKIIPPNLSNLVSGSAPGTAQNEVLSNFFQSLLSKKK